MKFVYLEEVLKLLLVSKRHPSRFVDFFDDSSLLIGFNFCCRYNRFTHLSQSFRNILGYEIDNVLRNDNLMDKIIHPHDRLVLERYLCENSIKNGNWVNDFEYGVVRIKCRAKHIRDYWKYLIFFSIDNWNEHTNSMYRTGLIADERIKSFLHSFPDSSGWSCKSSFYLKESFEENNTPKPKISISRREVEILELIGKGMIAKGIAEKLNISTSTVITHRKNLITKFHVRNTAELVKLSTQLMLV